MITPGRYVPGARKSEAASVPFLGSMRRDRRYVLQRKFKLAFERPKLVPAEHFDYQILID